MQNRKDAGRRRGRVDRGSRSFSMERKIEKNRSTSWEQQDGEVLWAEKLFTRRPLMRRSRRSGSVPDLRYGCRFGTELIGRVTKLVVGERFGAGKDEGFGSWMNMFVGIGRQPLWTCAGGAWASWPLCTRSHLLEQSNQHSPNLTR